MGRLRTLVLSWVVFAPVFTALVVWRPASSPSSTVVPPPITHRTTPRPSPPSVSPSPSQEHPKPSQSWGPKVVGPLGRLGTKAGLHHLLSTKLCNMCRPEKEGLPGFCSGEVDPGTVHFEGNPVPDRARAALLPAKLPVVLVGLGGRLLGGTGGQGYVEEAIRQWRVFNPPEESTVYLIVDDSFRTTPTTAVHRWAEQYTVKLVYESEVSFTEEWRRYLEVFYIQGYMHPGGDRKRGNRDFNRLTMQRFHAVHALMLRENLTHVVHFENDIMVYGRWKEMIEPIVSCGARLASTFASPKGVIPSLVYIRDAEAVGHMVRFVNGILACGEPCRKHRSDPAGCKKLSEVCRWTNKGTEAYNGSCQPNFGYSLNAALKVGLYANDMTYLLNYWQYYGTEALTPLPAWEHIPTENCIADLAPGELYDLASFGQWYSFSPPGVTPPRPPKHVVLSMKNGRFLDPSPPPYLKWEVDAQGRRTPQWKNYKLRTLHIHGKNLWRFRSVDPEER